MVLLCQEQSWTRTTQRIAAMSLISIGTPAGIVALQQQILSRGEAHSESLVALTAILPQVTEEWYGQLPAGTDAALVSLANSAESDIALAALNALEKAGSGDSVEIVERLAARTWSTTVRERLTALLPILTARREQERAASTLLRASSNAGVENLVRPIYNSRTEVSKLLRASHVADPSFAEANEE